MKKKLLLMLMIGSLVSPSFVFSDNLKNKVVAQNKEQMVDINIVPYINGNKLDDFSKIDEDALKVATSYFDNQGNEHKIFSNRNGENLVLKVFKNTRGVQLYPSNINTVNEYGVRVKGCDFKYFKEKDRPVFDGLPTLEDDSSSEPNYLNTKEDSYLAINYELKYDLKINFENETQANNVEIKLLDHDNKELNIQKEVNKSSVILKDIEYNVVKSCLKLKLDNKVFKLKSNENVKENEKEKNVFMLNPNFKGKKVNDQRRLEFSMDVKEVKNEVSKPLDITDKSLREEIYKNNFELYKYIPADVDENKAKDNFDIYPSQVDYINNLTISENSNANGVYKLTNVTNLVVKGEKHKDFNFSMFKNLKYLDIDSVGITTLDVSSLKNLKSIKANNNNLKELIFDENNNIYWLDLKNNCFKNGLDFSKLTSLYHLDLSDQKEKLEKIDVTPLTNLIELNLERHNLKTLDISKNTKLERISLDNDKDDNMGLTEIDLSNNKKLTAIYLKENKLQELKLENLTLSGLNINGNSLKTIDLSKVKFKKDYSYFDSIQRIKYKTNDFRKIDMSKIVGKENLDKVKVDEKDKNLSYNKDTGILNIASKVESFNYIYNTKNSGVFSSMVVNVQLELDKTSKEINKEKQVKPNEKKDDKLEDIYLKNSDNSTVISGNTNTLKSTWKVIVNSVNVKELAKKDYDAFDIKLEDENNKEVEPKKDVTVTIKVRKNVKKLYYVNNGLNEIPFIYKDGKITFNTNHFSVYAVVYEDKKDDDKKIDDERDDDEKLDDDEKRDDSSKEKNNKAKLPKTSISNKFNYVIASFLALGLIEIIRYKKEN